MRQLHGHSPMALSLTPRALKSTSEPSGVLREAHCGQTVVGIDLDMSSCSMSYRINNAGPVKSVYINIHRATVLITLLLSKHDGHNCRIDNFGQRAIMHHNFLFFNHDHELGKHHYFELNMLLYRHKVSTAME